MVTSQNLDNWHCPLLSPLSDIAPTSGVEEVDVGAVEKCSPSAGSREVIPEELSHQPKAQLPPSFLPFTSLTSPLLKANLCVCVCVCGLYVRESVCMQLCTHLGLQTPFVPLLLLLCVSCFGALTEEGVQGTESGPRTRCLLFLARLDPPTSVGVRGTLKLSHVVTNYPIPQSRLWTQP